MIYSDLPDYFYVTYSYTEWEGMGWECLKFETVKGFQQFRGR